MKTAIRLISITLLANCLIQTTSAQSEEPSKIGKPASKEQGAENKKTDANEPKQTIVVTVVQPPKTPEQIAVERTEKDKEASLQRDANDTNKQLARYTLFALLISAIVGAIAVVQAFISGINANAAMRSADIAERSLLATDRPWVFPQISSTPVFANSLLMFAEGETTRPVLIDTQVEIVNVGRSPATIEKVELRFDYPGAAHGEQQIDTFKPLLAGERHTFARINAVFDMTPDTRHSWMQNPPPLRGKVWYRTPHGRLKLLSFAFRKEALHSQNWIRFGGKGENHEVDVEET